MNDEPRDAQTDPSRPVMRWARPSLPVLATALVIIGQLVAVYFFGGGPKSPAGEEPSIVSRIQAQVKTGEVNLDFAQVVTSFDWDRMYVFGPYTTRATVDRALGASWNELDNAPVDRGDDACLVVFVRRGEPVVWYMQPRTVDLVPLASGSPYSRIDAVFRVTPSGEGRWKLEPRPASAS